MNLTTHFLSLGWTRDDIKWLVMKIVSVATLITSGVIDVPYWAAYVGLTPTTVEVHIVQVVAIVVMWIAGSYDSSKLPPDYSKPGGSQS